MTKKFCTDFQADTAMLCLSDPKKTTYAAFGLSQGELREILNLNVAARGIQAILHGHFVGRPHGDTLQMPGVFIVDQEGIVRYAHRNKDVADNPPNSALFNVLEAIASAS